MLEIKMKGMKVIIIGIFVFAVAAMRVTKYFGLEKWHISMGLVGLAILLYLLNTVLIQYFIRRRTLDFASSEEVLPGTQKWELTAGLGIVPKWVSVIGLLAISALVTAVLPWAIALLKR
jgi:L-lactate permease